MREREREQVREKNIESVSKRKKGGRQRSTDSWCREGEEGEERKEI